LRQFLLLSKKPFLDLKCGVQFLCEGAAVVHSLCEKEKIKRPPSLLARYKFLSPNLFLPLACVVNIPRRHLRWGGGVTLFEQGWRRR
jgi:hypothetical protein